ncbi:MAG TPA: heparan-alpha-glucosaminide N-acetyltransferase domain-containing protein, partial [Arthrobacter sp.]
MTSRATAKPSRAPRSSSAADRLRGIDAARGLALLGMMATHLLPTFESNAELTPTWIGLTFSGRAAALFAVLAGIGLALSTGKQVPAEGAPLGAARRGIALRAAVIAAVGLTLGGLEVNLA